MKRVAWNLGKNTKLKTERGVSFEDVFERLRKGAFRVKKNPSKKYRGQCFFLITVNSRFFAVPFTEYESHIFLRTIYEIKP